MNMKRQLHHLHRAVDAACSAVTQYEALVQRGNLALAQAQADVVAHRMALAVRLCDRFGLGAGKEQRG